MLRSANDAVYTVWDKVSVFRREPTGRFSVANDVLHMGGIDSVPLFRAVTNECSFTTWNNGQDHESP